MRIVCWSAAIVSYAATVAASTIRGVASIRVENDRRQLSSTPLRALHSHPSLPLVERDDKVRRYPRFQRQRLLQAAATPNPQLSLPEDPFDEEVDQLFQGYGTHYVDLWVGSPKAQRQTVIVDTGSSVTAFPCSQCHQCGQGYHVDNAYNETASSSFRPISCGSCQLGSCVPGGGVETCDIHVAYQEGSSWLAFEAVDVAYSGGLHDRMTTEKPFEFHFGCQTQLTGLFQTQLEGGIMGMDLDGPSYWKQMFKNGRIEEPMFSLCFSRQPVVSRTGTQAGAMTMGGTDTRLHTTPMVYAAQTNTGAGWYVVRIRKMYLRSGSGGERVTPVGPADVVLVDTTEPILNGNGNVIVDSGTTDTFLPRSLSAPFHEAWTKVTGGKTFNNNAIELSDAQLLALPTVLIQLQAWSGEQPSNGTAPGHAGNLDPEHPTDIVVAFPPTHYMEYSKKSSKYTARLYFEEPIGGVLGANFMMGHDILFDIKNHRLGFAESDCDYAHVAKEDSSG